MVLEKGMLLRGDLGKGYLLWGWSQKGLVTSVECLEKGVYLLC